MTFNPISAFLMLPVMLILIELGRRFRIKHQAPPESTAIEGAIFALFGLLLAFTFSGGGRALRPSSAASYRRDQRHRHRLPPPRSTAAGRSTGAPPALPRLHQLA